MDFFEAQDITRRRTRVLMVYFSLAVIAVSFAVYIAVSLGFWMHAVFQFRPGTQIPFSFWEPMRMVVCFTVTVVWIGMSSLSRYRNFLGGGQAVAKSMGGRRLDVTTKHLEERQLVNVVEEIAIAAGLPVPEIYLLDLEPGLNAFAAGFTPDDAVVVFTQGCIDHFSRDELQAVAGHEISHILNGDARLNLIMAATLHGLLSLTIFGRGLGKVFKSDNEQRFLPKGRGTSPQGAGGLILLIIILVAILVTVIGYTGNFFGRLIQAAISRQREILADATAVQLTRNPEGLSSALRKIGGTRHRAFLDHPESISFAHTFFASGLDRPWWERLETHPPIESRIRAIDPKWDGSYIFVEIKRRILQLLAKSKTRPPTPQGPDFTNNSRLLSRLQQPATSIQLGMLRGLLRGLPEDIGEQLHDPFRAQAMVLTLLLSPSATVRKVQLHSLRTTLHFSIVNAIDEYLKIQGLRNCDNRKVVLLELSLPALGEMTSGEYYNFLQHVERLTDPQTGINLFAFIAGRIIKQRLQSKVEGTPAHWGDVSYHGMDSGLAEACSMILSCVASVSAHDETRARELFQTAVRPQYLLNGHLRFAPENSRSWAAVDQALDRLDLAAYPIRSQLIRASSLCVRHDGQLSGTEYGLVRMLSGALGCPIPHTPQY